MWKLYSILYSAEPLHADYILEWIQMVTKYRARWRNLAQGVMLRVKRDSDGNGNKVMVSVLALGAHTPARCACVDENCGGIDQHSKSPSWAGWFI
jgi:hypothetical protein